MTNEEDDWRHRERLDGLVHKIPMEFQINYQKVFNKVGSSQRVDIMRLLDQQDFNHCICSSVMMLLMIMIDTDADELSGLIIVLVCYAKGERASKAVEFLLAVDDLLKPFLMLPAERMDYFFKLVHYNQHEDIVKMVGFIRLLNFDAYLEISDRCQQDSKISICNLCRLRRLKLLEEKMLRNLLAPDALPIAGSIINPSEQWTASASMEFKFQFIMDGGVVVDAVVVYNSANVDIISICDACLSGIYAATSTPGRHVELYHLLPESRIPLIEEQRKIERQMASLMEKLSGERVRRRTKELILQLLARVKEGLHNEAATLAGIDEDLRQAKELEAHQTVKASLLQESYASWDKWKAEDDCFQRGQLGVARQLAQLDYHIPFGNVDSMVHKGIEREDPRSWRLAHYREDAGVQIPITPQSAAEVFGTALIEPEIKSNELIKWKNDALRLTTEHEEAERERWRREEEARRTEHESQVEFVRKKLEHIEKKDHRRKVDALMKEERRVQQRKQDKADRYAARIRGYELTECRLMTAEDARSSEMRRLWLERQREARELERMRKEEKVQCLVDMFWGVDLAERLRGEEEERRRRAYDALVEERRVTCVKVKIIRPKAQEARDRVYRDRVTGSVLT